MALDAQQRKTSLVVPILLITLGALFLFKNWHPGFEPYQVLKTYWPLILIYVYSGKCSRENPHEPLDGLPRPHDPRCIGRNGFTKSLHGKSGGPSGQV